MTAPPAAEHCVLLKGAPLDEGLGEFIWQMRKNSFEPEDPKLFLRIINFTTASLMAEGEV